MSIKIDLKIFGLLLILLIGGKSNTYLILFIFTFIHELGHLFCGLIFGLKPESIKLMPIGLSIQFKRKTKNWIKRVIICLAGPLVNFIIAGIVIIYNKQNLNIFYSNLLIGIFNLIPILPLDGGKTIKIIFEQFCLYKKAYKYIRTISYISLVLFTIIALIGTIYLKNISVVITIIYLWVINVNENKKLKVEHRIKTLINAQKIIDKKVL